MGVRDRALIRHAVRDPRSPSAEEAHPILYEEERKSVKMQITDISEKISERRAKRVPESEYVPITEFSEEKAKRFLSKVVVTMFTVTFVFYNGAKITRIYDNGQPGNKVGWNKKKEES